MLKEREEIKHKLMSCSRKRHEIQSSEVTTDQKKSGKCSPVMVSFPTAVGDAVVIPRASLLLGNSF